MKKLLAIALALVMVLATVSFASAEGYKVAILTGTASQGDEEIAAATDLVNAYPGKVLHDTYPDNFSSEVETTISKLLAFAEDPEVKAIIFVQGVQGCTAAYNQIKESRPDILLICGVPAEDPAPVSAAADICLANDEIGCGYQVADLANAWGCEVLVHYSFARHLGYETIQGKRIAMKDTAETYGIEFVDRDSPDPTGDAGMSGAQAAILEDVPKVMEEYAGKKVCFYCTNCGMQVALQQAVLKEENAYYALPCCPSPYHGFQEAFGLDSKASDGDATAALNELANFLAENNAVDRFSTWSLAVNATMIKGMYLYACEYAEGKTDGKYDQARIDACLSEAAGVTVSTEPYVAADGSEIENYRLMALDPISFSDFVTK